MLTGKWIVVCLVAAASTAALTSGLLVRGSETPAPPARIATPAAVSSGVPTPGLRCPHVIPNGDSFAVAWQLTVFFVKDVLMRHNPVCGYDLSSRGLRGNLSRMQWAKGEAPVQPFVTQYPAVPVAEASADPAAPQAVYVLSRRRREVYVADAQGRIKAPLMVGLAAPDAGMAAYNVVLVLEEGHWRIDQVAAVELSMSDQPTAGQDQTG